MSDDEKRVLIMAGLVIIGGLLIVWAMWGIAIHDFCPLFYHIKCLN